MNVCVQICLFENEIRLVVSLTFFNIMYFLKPTDVFQYHLEASQ